MAKGGKRPGAGRKKDPAKDVRLGALTALKFLKEIDDHKALKTIFNECRDARLQVHIIMKMREWAHDKPAQPLRLANEPGKKFEVDVTSARDKLVAALLG
jgi:hypothetical protein